MDYIVRPKIREPGTGKAAAGDEAPQDRLLKYIPLTIAGAYPILENGIAQYITTPVADMSPRFLEWLVFAALILYYVLFLNVKFNATTLQGWTRIRLQTLQTVVSIIAFFVWTYSIKSAIWTGVYNAGLALIVAMLFVLFAGLYAPTVSLDEARAASLLPPEPEVSPPPKPA
ncbi:MAG: hypothetical protein WB764_16915 [Xanthobacteraceae bacterium]